jgi:hypothetical protein
MNKLSHNPRLYRAQRGGLWRDVVVVEVDKEDPNFVKVSLLLPDNADLEDEEPLQWWEKRTELRPPQDMGLCYLDGQVARLHRKVTELYAMVHRLLERAAFVDELAEGVSVESAVSLLAEALHPHPTDSQE